MHKIHSAILIGDYIIAHGNKFLTPLHVLKLTYISHGYTLALYDRPLIDDRVEAWQYGPVIPPLYQSLRQYGDRQISRLSYCHTDLRDVRLEERKEYLRGELESEVPLLNKVLEEYGALTGADLITLTHKKGTPWEQCYVKGKNAVIPDGVTKEYYEGLMHGIGVDPTK